MNRLTVERLEEKTKRIQHYLSLTGGDWERTFFITLARNFGFGTNAQAFEQWALTIDPQAIGKHRDNPLQVEAFFMGHTGLLDPQNLAPDRIDEHFTHLQTEYDFLRHKFGLAAPHGQSLEVWAFASSKLSPRPALATRATLCGTANRFFASA